MSSSQRMNGTTTIFLLTIGLALLTTQALAESAPPWFETCELPHASHERLGCGQGKTQQEARAQALAAIAQQLRAEIRSRVERSTQVVGAQPARHDERVELLVRSEMELHIDRELRKVESAGSWYIALAYEDLPYAKKLARRIRPATCQPEPQHPYLAATPLIQAIQRETGCPLALTLYRQNQSWSLYHQQTGLPLRPDDFLELLANVDNPALTLQIHPQEKAEWREEEPINFSARPARSGYLSLINVYEDGKTIVLVANRPLPAGIPTRLFAEDLRAGTLDGRLTHDLYVAFLSAAPLDWSRYPQVGETPETDERATRFHEILERMTHTPFATRLVRTRGR